MPLRGQSQRALRWKTFTPEKPPRHDMDIVHRFVVGAGN
jgi:hypothetical protein